MFDRFVFAVELVLLVVAAAALSWSARVLIRLLTRRAMRLAQQRPGSWRTRLRRLSEQDTDAEARRRQRADAAARMLGHVVTLLVVVGAIVVGLNLLGMDPVYVISSAGFVGFALALSGQDLIRNLLAGMTALLEDRYAVGDDVAIRIDGTDVRGTIDLMGAASIRLRTTEGATWHTGHSNVHSVTNYSQMPASSEIAVATDRWLDVEDSAARRLAASSNDVGLTGVVFLPHLDAQPHPSGTTTVTVRSNRALTNEQRDLVRERLVDGS